MKKLYIFIIIFMFILSCDPYENPLTKNAPKREILIYSGITMSDAIFELKDIYEKETGCRASVIYGASGYLKSVIEVNRVGDIFFPGYSTYLESMMKEKVISRVIDVGYNKLCFFVEKHNPLMLNGSLDQLKEKNLRVMIGSREAGAVGKETEDLLRKHGMYEDVVLNIRSFTADSKGLSEAIRDKNADIVINWRATGFFKKNQPYMDPVEIDSDYVRKVPIAMGLLKYSVDVECAERFLDLAASETGKKIFNKYGFTD